MVLEGRRYPCPIFYHRHNVSEPVMHVRVLIIHTCPGVGRMLPLLGHLYHYVSIHQQIRSLASIGIYWAFGIP